MHKSKLERKKIISSNYRKWHYYKYNRAYVQCIMAALIWIIIQIFKKKKTGKEQKNQL